MWAATRHNAFGLTPRDVVLAAFPHTDDRQCDLLAACQTAGARLILSEAEMNPQKLADAIKQKNVTVTATTPEVWPKLYEELNNGGLVLLRRVRALIFNGKPEPEQCDHLMWHTQYAD